MHYYSHHLGDYAKDTGHLSLAEHGAYRMLLDHYYATESGLPDNLDALCRICRATNKAERQAVDSVLSQFFFAEEKTFRHRRVEREISDYRQKSESAARAGKMSGEARRMKAEHRTSVERPLNVRSISVAVPLAVPLNQPLTINQEPSKPPLPPEGDGLESSISKLFKAEGSTRPCAPFTASEKNQLKTLVARLGREQVEDDLELFTTAKSKGWEYYSRDRKTLMNQWDKQVMMADEFREKRNGSGSSQYGLLNPQRGKC